MMTTGLLMVAGGSFTLGGYCGYRVAVLVLKGKRAGRSLKRPL